MLTFTFFSPVHLQFVSGWRGSFPVGLGCPHLGEEEPGSHQLDQVARPEEGPGLPRPQFLLFLALETSIFFAAYNRWHAVEKDFGLGLVHSCLIITLLPPSISLFCSHF